MIKVIDGKIIDMTEEEIAELEAMQQPTETEPTLEEQVSELQSQLQEQKEINEAQDETIVEIFESILA